MVRVGGWVGGRLGGWYGLERGKGWCGMDGVYYSGWGVLWDSSVVFSFIVFAFSVGALFIIVKLLAFQVIN